MNKFIVHVIGRDDLIEFGGQLEALQYANGINKTVAKIKRTPNDPVVFAVVYHDTEPFR